MFELDFELAKPWTLEDEMKNGKSLLDAWLDDQSMSTAIRRTNGLQTRKKDKKKTKKVEREVEMSCE